MSKQLEQLDSLIYIYKNYSETLPPIKDPNTANITILTIRYLKLLRAILKKRNHREARLTKRGISTHQSRKPHRGSRGRQARQASRQVG